MQKITDLVDIAAPCEDVFATIINCERRMQLNPLWGVARLLEVSPDFPHPGSFYRVRILTGAPFGLAEGRATLTQNALAGLVQVLYLKLSQADLKQERQSSVDTSIPDDSPESKGQETPPLEQKYIVAECEPPNKLKYCLSAGGEIAVTWRLQSIPFGARLIYEEEFSAGTMADDDLIPKARQMVQEWLSNIKRYNELRGSRGRSILKWSLDRFFLRMRPDQRRVVVVLLFMQAVGLIAFLLALAAWGILRFLVFFYSSFGS